MSEEKKIHGFIDCPVCGLAGGIRITADKNGAPFGYCERGCEVQLRIGGKPRRVSDFLKRYPAIAKSMQGENAEPASNQPIEKPKAKSWLDDLGA